MPSPAPAAEVAPPALVRAVLSGHSALAFVAASASTGPGEGDAPRPSRSIPHLVRQARWVEPGRVSRRRGLGAARRGIPVARGYPPRSTRSTVAADGGGRGPSASFAEGALIVSFDRGLELGRALEPVALAQPLERGLERLLVGHVRRDPAVAADVARDAHVRQQVRDLALLLGQLDGHVDGTLTGDHPGEHLVLADLEDREVAPRPVLVGLGERERQLRDPPLDRRHPHRRIVAVSSGSGQGTRMQVAKDKRRTSMGKSIRELMSSNPCAIEADKPVAYAAQMMKQEDVGLAPVVEGDRLVGTLTDRDIVVRVVAEGRNPEEVSVREVASTDLVTVDPQQDLDEALRLMASNQIRRLPVVEEDGRLVGVLAQADVAREADEQQTGQLVEDISQP